MRKIGAISASLLFLIMTPACGDKSSNTEIVSVETGDVYIGKELRKELDSKSIWYSVESETSINVKKESAEQAIQILNEIGEPLLPANRHASFSGATYEKVIAELEKNGIHFDVIEAFNDKWIVWEGRDTDKVKEIIDRVTLPIE